MSNSRKPETLKKISLTELKDILHRENELLKNSKLINKLPDKGESIKIFLEKVEQEIKFRENLKNIKESISKLSLGEEEKHIQKLCDIEKLPEKDRYKPFATLNMVKDVKPDSKIFKIMEDCAHCNKPTKLILLPESIEILKKQDEKVKGEQEKARYNRMLEKLQENKENEESSSDSEGLEHCSEPEEELDS